MQELARDGVVQKDQMNNKKQRNNMTRMIALTGIKLEQVETGTR